MNALASIAEALSIMEGEQSSTNNAQWLLDAWRAKGFTMRLTLGTVALIKEIGLPCALPEKAKMTVRDCIAFAVFTSDEWRSDCVLAVANGEDAVESLIDDVAGSVGKRRSKRLIPIIEAMLETMDDRSVVENEGDGEAQSNGGESKSANWWATGVMSIAKNTGWSEYYILWQLPVWRFHSYVSALEEANGKDSKSNGVDKGLLKAAEFLKERMEEQANGEDSSS